MRHISLLGIGLILLFGLGQGIVWAQEPALVRPAEAEQKQRAASEDDKKQSQAASLQTEEQDYKQRTGSIAIASSYLIPRAQLVPGERISVGLFEDVNFKITVSHVKERSNGTVTVTGRVDGAERDTFTLTAGPDGFLMSVTDAKGSMYYRASGQIGPDTGSVLEMRAADRPGARHPEGYRDEPGEGERLSEEPER